MLPSTSQGRSNEATASLDVQEVMDRQAFGPYHVRVAVLCAAAVLLDGFDAQMIGFVAPALARQWHISRAALSPILSSGLVGMFLGALVFGPLADRFGRKRVLVVCTLWFGVFSLIAARAESVQSMVLLRLMTGLGLGGTLPNAIALTAEYMPRRLRATGIMLMFSGVPIGAAAGGLAAASLISRFGWPSVFVLGGILPCAAGALAFGLPESIRFLVLKGGENDRVANLLGKIAPDVPTSAGTKFTVSEYQEPGFPVKRLFTQGRARLTLLLWLIFFMSLLDLYFLNSWLPTILHDTGLGLRAAIVITATFQLGGAVGSVVLGRYIDRRASYRVLVWAYFVATLSVFAIGMISASITLEVIAIIVAGFSVIGAQTGANSLAAESYPTGVRATGSGWALGIGRIGSIVGPVVGGMLLSSRLEMKRVFWVAAIPPLIAGLAARAIKLRVEEPL